MDELKNAIAHAIRRTLHEWDQSADPDGRLLVEVATRRAIAAILRYSGKRPTQRDRGYVAGLRNAWSLLDMFARTQVGGLHPPTANKLAQGMLGMVRGAEHRLGIRTDDRLVDRSTSGRV